MKINKAFGWSTLATLLSLNLGAPAQAVQPVLQRGYDPGLSGANLSETTLNTSNISVNSFGALFSLPVDDVIYAQPLYVPNVAIPGQGTHNVLYVATMSDTLYAFDADAGGELWSVNFANSVGESPVDYSNFSYGGNQNIVGNNGILSTPVIDSSTNTLYLVALTLENGTMAYRLHAVNIRSGAEVNAPGVEIAGNYNGIQFNPRNSTQRASLTLADNQVVFGFGAVEAEFSGEGVGWVMAYNKSNLQQSGIFATESSGNGAGVWQSGRPPVVDSQGYVYVFTGNAYGNGYDGVNNFSESAVKLDPSNGLNLVDWFTPSNWSSMDTNDQDLSSSGPMLVPGANLLVGGGKTGFMYVLNTGNLGHYNGSDSQIVQKDAISTHSLNGGPVYWQRSSGNGGPLLYNWAAHDPLKAFAFYGSTFATSPNQQGGPSPTWPGGVLALSANGSQSGSGVVWGAIVTSGDANNSPPAPGTLYAFDAGSLNELWDTTQNSGRDSFGDIGKFVPPTVANGKVYLATWSNQVVVYGLLSTLSVSQSSLSFGNQPLNTASSAMPITVTNTGVVPLAVNNISLTSSSPQPFSQSNNCGSQVAVNGHCTINVVFNPSSLGATSATLSIATGAGTGTQTVALSGSGTATYSVSQTSVAFGNQPLNSPSAPMPVTVSNGSSQSLAITSITLSTSGSQPYSQTNNCGSSIAVGANCTINVVFNPASPGAAPATLAINTNAATSNVSLSGTGSFSVALAASAQSVSAGTPVTLSWSSATGASCSASGGNSTDNWSGTLPANGSQAVTESAAGNYSYGLTCSSQGTSANATVAVVVTASTAATPDVTLTASASSVDVGQSVTLTWNSQNASSCTGTGGLSGGSWDSSQPLQGTATMSLNTAGMVVFTLTCTSGPMAQAATATVNVTGQSSTAAGGGGGGGGGAFGGIDLLLLSALAVQAVGRRRLRLSDTH